jgi:7,8-dihydropterin-6-yl-methyl-4-(beta-D-ribofuranosyl)aminobenzene 5'-phosphate synthase
MKEMTILYENYAEGELRPGWGFSAFLRTEGATVLFDVGADKMVLEHNAAHLGVDLDAIAALALSHEHCDHIGAISAALHKGLHLYVPRAFSKRFSRNQRAGINLHAVKSSLDIVPGVRSIGQMGREIPEQALLIEGERGFVLLTGCAHMGITKLARRALEIAGEPLEMVIGGFHLYRQSAAHIESIVSELQNLGVRRVAPCHCTGKEATAAFRTAFEEGFMDIAVGTVIKI